MFRSELYIVLTVTGRLCFNFKDNIKASTLLEFLLDINIIF